VGPNEGPKAWVDLRDGEYRQRSRAGIATAKGEKPDPAAKPRWHDPASGRAITAHGFRATFKTWAEEVATFPHAAIEHAMGHKVGGKIERAYTRTTLLDMRRKLMDAWAAYCEPKATDGKVTPLRRKA
jgi:integrase